jgi:hypothetical protein
MTVRATIWIHRTVSTQKTNLKINWGPDSVGATDQAKRRFLTADATVQFQGSLRGIYIRQIGTGVGFSASTFSFQLPRYLSNAPHLSVIRGCYSGPIWDHSIGRLNISPLMQMKRKGYWHMLYTLCSSYVNWRLMCPRAAVNTTLSLVRIGCRSPHICSDAVQRIKCPAFVDFHEYPTVEF